MRDEVTAVDDFLDGKPDHLNEIGASASCGVNKVPDEQDHIIHGERETRNRAFEDRLIGDSGRTYAFEQAQTFFFCHSWQQSSVPIHEG
ncbi:hypothetical protein [Rhizobium sp.]|uniref:hypothetical protein n=1 Tax=Rhizobium sp. TaxID=391 RepID=UPI002896DC65